MGYHIRFDSVMLKLLVNHQLKELQKSNRFTSLKKNAAKKERDQGSCIAI